MRNFKITVGGNTYDVAVEEVNGVSQVQSAPAVQSAPVAQAAPVAAPAAPAQPKAAAPAGGTSVTAPMPGTILNIVTQSGSAVKKGQVICVLEAMKMENDITAPCDGTVTIITTKGATVANGDVLASIN